jgi:hypothetical protein
MKWLCAMLCVLVVTRVGGADAVEPVRPLAEYRALADRCAVYGQLASARAWEAVFARNPAQGDTSPNSLSLATSDARLESGDRVLRLIAAENHPALLRVGPPVSGEFAVEYEARITGQRLYHMSIVVDTRNRGPGFVFGGDDNQRNRLFTDARPENRAGGSVELKRDVLLERNRWTTVRMEVQGGQVRGFVDGKMIGSAPMHASYEYKTPRQPMLYTYGTTMEIRRITTQVLLDKPREADPQAFAKAFGDMTLPQVEQRIAELVKLLDADAWTTRQAAQDLLNRIGPLARPALEEAAAEGSAEQRYRARQVLGIADEKTEQTGDEDEVEQIIEIFE